MATASSTTNQIAPMPLRRKMKYAAIGVGVLAALWLIYNFKDIKAQAELGAAYGAHIACSCRYIEGRTLKSCESDFEPGMELVSLSDDPARKRVTASVPLLAHAVAERRGDFGCIQLNEREIEQLD